MCNLGMQQFGRGLQMGHCQRRRSRLEILEQMDVKMTWCSRAAAGMDDELLVYLLDMAIVHTRKQAASLVKLPNRSWMTATSIAAVAD